MNICIHTWYFVNQEAVHCGKPPIVDIPPPCEPCKAEKIRSGEVFNDCEECARRMLCDEHFQECWPPSEQVIITVTGTFDFANDGPRPPEEY